MISPRGVSYGRTKVQSSLHDQTFETVEMVRKLAKKIGDIEYQLAMRQLEAVCLIYSLDNPDYRRVLILYYLDGHRQKNWNDVAELMDYSESRVKHFHGWALEELERAVRQQDQ